MVRNDHILCLGGCGNALGVIIIEDFRLNFEKL